MPATGVSGLDLYLHRDHGWRWAGVGRPTRSPTNQVRLAGGIPAAGMRDWRLYLPLYNGIESLSLGIPRQATIRPAAPPTAAPLVVYGTSIVQGGCASRPGMAYPAILGRDLGLPVINLGFSGNGRAEPEVAALAAEPAASAIIFDALPNLTADQVAERVAPFLAVLRARHPQAPIIVVENITYQHQHALAPGRSDCVAKNAALRAAVGPLLAADRRMHLVPGTQLLGEDGEGTVDGVHPTDLGFVRIAAAIRPVLAVALRA
jgi:lysophospholipase L1-like esterase